jgi:hypothetical protein
LYRCIISSLITFVSDYEEATVSRDLVAEQTQIAAQLIVSPRVLVEIITVSIRETCTYHHLTSHEQLKKDKKTHIGSKFQTEFMLYFDLPGGPKRDTNIAGLNIELKFTTGDCWMIPPECINEWALLARGDPVKRICSLELVFLSRAILPNGRNRDVKKTLRQANLEWLGTTRWIVRPTALILDDC